MKLYQAFDVDEETPVQWLAVHPLRWQEHWGEPTIMFREIDNETQALVDAAPRMLTALKRVEQTLRNLARSGGIVNMGTSLEIVWNEVENLQRDIALVENEAS